MRGFSQIPAPVQAHTMCGMTSPTVVLADDTVALRAMVKRALRVYGDFDVVGEAENGAEAVDLCAELQPDVVVIDLSMPVMDGFTAVPLIRQSSPQTRVVVLAGLDTAGLQQAVAGLGVFGCADKTTHPERIVALVREAAAARP
jgi:DNA-binding NarL/FixJ family response regulator